MRTLAELRDVPDPAIDLVRTWISSASRSVTVLPPGPRAPEVLTTLQVTRRSPLGALAFDTGGILVDGGWLRMYGGGGDALARDLASWNQLDQAPHRLPGAIVVGEDAVGGFFAIDGGGLALKPGTVAYFAPDTLAWEDLGMGHTQWVSWAITGDVPTFYASMRWPGWERELAGVPTDRAFSIVPPLWAAGDELAKRSRTPVPVEELWNLGVVQRWGIR